MLETDVGPSGMALLDGLHADTISDLPSKRIVMLMLMESVSLTIAQLIPSF